MSQPVSQREPGWTVGTLRSRCTICCWCMYATAMHTSMNHFMIHCVRRSASERASARSGAREGARACGTYALAGMDAQAAELLGERLQAAARAVLHHEVELPARMCVCDGRAQMSTSGSQCAGPVGGRGAYRVAHEGVLGHEDLAHRHDVRVSQRMQRLRHHAAHAAH